MPNETSVQREVKVIIDGETCHKTCEELRHHLESLAKDSGPQKSNSADLIREDRRR